MKSNQISLLAILIKSYDPNQVLPFESEVADHICREAQDEFIFLIDDNTTNPIPTDYVKAIRISNSNSLLGDNFMEVGNNHNNDILISDYDALG